MVTISHLAEKLISEKPFLQDALYRGIINYRALADDLVPKIEKELGKDVKATTVMMALRRYKDKLEKNYIKDIEFGSGCDLNLQSDIVEISIKRSSTIFTTVPKMFDIVNFKEGGILNFTNGNYDVSLITNQRYKNDLLEILENEKIIDINEDVVALSFKYSKNFRETPGTLHHMIRTLAWENINIIELIETMTETIFILDPDDSLRAFKVLKGLINSK